MKTLKECENRIAKLESELNFYERECSEYQDEINELRQMVKFYENLPLGKVNLGYFTPADKLQEALKKIVEFGICDKETAGKELAEYGENYFEMIFESCSYHLADQKDFIRRMNGFNPLSMAYSRAVEFICSEFEIAEHFLEADVYFCHFRVFDECENAEKLFSDFFAEVKKWLENENTTEKEKKRFVGILKEIYQDLPENDPAFSDDFKLDFSLKTFFDDFFKITDKAENNAA